MEKLVKKDLFKQSQRNDLNCSCLTQDSDTGNWKCQSQSFCIVADSQYPAGTWSSYLDTFRIKIDFTFIPEQCRTKEDLALLKRINRCKSITRFKGSHTKGKGMMCIALTLSRTNQRLSLVTVNQ